MSSIGRHIAELLPGWMHSRADAEYESGFLNGSTVPDFRRLTKGDVTTALQTAHRYRTRFWRA